MNADQMADVLLPTAKSGAAHAYGNVKAINEDGSYEVQLNDSSVTTRCSRFCTASVGDLVLVLIKPNGKCDAIGRLGGTIGGDGSGVSYIAGSGIIIKGSVISAEVTQAELDAVRSEIPASGGSGGTGFFTLEVDEDGNLYAVYDDGEDPPSFELDSEGNLYYVIEE